MNWNETLTKLTASSPRDIVDVAESLFRKYVTVSHSPLGNFYGEIPGASDNVILLDAHIDEIAMLVVGIDADGFVLVDKCGGVDVRTLAGCEVTIWGKKPIYGVFSIVPPHLKKGKDDESLDVRHMRIDIGFSQEQAKEFVKPGDWVTLQVPLTALAENCVSCKGLDNRAGVAVLLRVCELIKQSKRVLPQKVVIQLTQMEEAGTGFVGGVTGAQAWQPTQAIVVDAGFAAYPGCSYSTPGGLLKGPMIGIAPILSRAMSDQLQRVALEQKIPFTLDVTGKNTGTNADRITSVGAGVPTALVSYPLQNMHMPAEIVCTTDLEHTARLIYAYLMKGGDLRE